METIIINMDRYSLEDDAVTLLAKELHCDEEEINTHLYNLWIDEKQTTLSQPETLQQLEEWFARPGQNIVWQETTVIFTIARQEIDVLALRTARAWLARQSGRIPRLYWLPSEGFRKTYREWVEKKTHPGSVALAGAPEITMAPDEARDDHPVVKRRFIVTLTAQAFVKGTLSIEVHPTCSEKEKETVALEHSGSVTWSYNGIIDGTEQVERIESIGESTVLPEK
jgi:hypothetical protein